MPRVVRLHGLAIVVATMLVLGACGGSDSVATVDGVDIPSEELLDMRTAYADADVLPGGELRNDLNLLIFAEALTQAAATDYGLEISEDDIDERIANPPERWTANFQGLAGSPEFGETRVRTEARLTLIRDAVVGPIILDEFGSLDAYVDALPAEVIQICGRHILLASASDAEAALERVQAGEEFDAVAAEVSIAPTPDLTPPDMCPVGVAPLGNEFAVAVAGAAEGEPFGPLATEFGFHVVVVDEKVLPTDEGAFRTDAAAFMDPGAVSTVFSDWFNAVAGAADVEVASSIGRWSAVGVGIAEPGS